MNHRRLGIAPWLLTVLVPLAAACNDADDPAPGQTSSPDDTMQEPSMEMPGEATTPTPGENPEPTQLPPDVSTTGTVPPVSTDPVWFRDDFESGNTSNWDLTPGDGAAFLVVTEPEGTNHVLQYAAGATTDNVIALISDAAWAATEAKAGATPLANYYVEARIKPQNNGTTGNKQLFLIARYQDAANWYLGGLNVQNDAAATRVEAGYNKASTIARPFQAAREIVQGTQGYPDGQWYNVRLDVVDGTLSVYLDGEPLGSTTDTDFTSGKIGLFTANKSFLIDDIVVGDPVLKPVSLVLSPPTLQRSVEAETAPLTIDVRALKNDGTTPDDFSVVSDNEAVVSVLISGTTVTLTPVAAGTAHVAFTSGSEPSLNKVLTLTVTPPYSDAVGTYPGLATLTQPAVAQAAVPVDTTLALTFGAPPTLGQGSIRIFRTSDDSVVDTISVGPEIDTLGPAAGTAGGRVRQVNTTLVRVDGNTLRIKPHGGALEYGGDYYIGIAEGAVTGTLAGLPFTGLGEVAGWRFSMQPAAPTGANVTVDDNGTANFRSVQGALDYVMTLDAATAANITVRNGTYHELLFLRGKNNLTITGESRDGVVVEAENYDGLNPGSGASTATPGATAGGGRAQFLVEAVDLLTLESFTLRNTHRRATGTGDQAETIYFNADQGRLAATGMRFTSEQDTLQLKGYTWVFNSLVEGNVDFIWGNNRVALFENSEIRSLGDSRSANPSGGYVVQARTVTLADKGFVFLNSRFTQGPGPAGTVLAAGATYLARSGGSATYFDNVSVINSQIDTHIAALGWAQLGVNNQPVSNPAQATATTGWKEFGSTNLAGTALALGTRAAAARVLTAPEVAAGFANRAQILSAFNNGAGWNPVP